MATDAFGGMAACGDSLSAAWVSADERIEADERFMREALAQARRAAAEGEVPIGAVVVCQGHVIAEGRNHREADADPSAHAEFTAICRASRELGRWRLPDCTVYVTLEPCIMCAGLMHQARIGRCVFGAADPKAGALGSLYAVNADARLNHAFPATGGVLADECAALLAEFFAARRRGGAADGCREGGGACGCARPEPRPGESEESTEGKHKG